MKELGVEAKIIPKNLATTLAVLFGEEVYPKMKVDD